MTLILVLYATQEGHTRHIAEHLAAALTTRRLTTDLIDAAHMQRGFSLANYSAPPSVHPFTSENTNRR